MACLYENISYNHFQFYINVVNTLLSEFCYFSQTTHCTFKATEGWSKAEIDKPLEHGRASDLRYLCKKKRRNKTTSRKTERTSSPFIFLTHTYCRVSVLQDSISIHQKGLNQRKIIQTAAEAAAGIRDPTDLVVRNALFAIYRSQMYNNCPPYVTHISTHCFYFMI